MNVPLIFLIFVIHELSALLKLDDQKSLPFFLLQLFFLKKQQQQKQKDYDKRYKGPLQK